MAREAKKREYVVQRLPAVYDVEVGSLSYANRLRIFPGDWFEMSGFRLRPGESCRVRISGEVR